MSMRVAILGGGLSGLTAAYELERQSSAEIVVFESSSSLGGLLGSDRIGDYLVEKSADMFTTQPSAALDLVRALGHEQDLITTEPVVDRAFIGVGKEIHPVPQGFSLMQPAQQYSVLNSRLLDWDAKARFFRERFLGFEKSSSDISLAEFARARYGQQVFQRLVQPLAAGIYTADPDLLSMDATMEKFRQQVAQSGSLISAGENVVSESHASGARYNLFRAPKEGMGQLIDWLTHALSRTEVRVNSKIQRIHQHGSHWKVADEIFDAVILTAPSRINAQLLQESQPMLSSHLKRLRTAGSALIVAGIKKEQLKTAFPGFGLLFPACEARPLIALSFSSNKFAGRAPEDSYLIRAFAGGALQPELVDADEETLMIHFARELDRWFGFKGKLDFYRIYRWPGCMPQYHVGHLEWRTQLETMVSKLPGLELAGNSYWGVGIPACIESSQNAVKRLLEQFAMDRACI